MYGENITSQHSKKIKWHATVAVAQPKEYVNVLWDSQVSMFFLSHIACTMLC